MLVEEKLASQSVSAQLAVLWPEEEAGPCYRLHLNTCLEATYFTSPSRESPLAATCGLAWWSSRYPGSRRVARSC